ncbi:hypothetical protein ACXYMO_05735 [Arenibacterium sp. CAU 1754]
MSLTLASAAAAQVQQVDYDTLAQSLGGRISFEDVPSRTEPGLNLDGLYRMDGATVGERLAGQVVGARDTHDDIAIADLGRPPRALPGAAGRNLSVAYHRGFGSNALFPLGPTGFPDISARGEGAVSVVFDTAQDAIALRIHADYPDPLGVRPRPGAARITFYALDGSVLDSRDLPLGHGITDFGFLANAQGPRISALSITNTDPGGIAIDDILFQRRALTG